MTDMPKGFYTGPDGRERFWDGEGWHDSPNHQPAKLDKPGPIARFKALKSRTKTLVLVISAVIILSVVGGGIGAVAAQESAARSAIAAEELAQEKKDKSEAAADAKAARAVKAAEAEQALELFERQSSVTAIEASVKTMAEGHAADGIIDGPILAIGCTTTGGIPIEDMSIRSMLFECFATNVENADGTASGYYYHARANWDDGSWTYGLGRE